MMIGKSRALIFVALWFVSLPVDSVLAQEPANRRGGGVNQNRLATSSEERSVVIEGESLLQGENTAKATGGQLSAQDMQAFGKSWSGNSQLFWRPEKIGNRLTIPISASKAADYQVAAVFTKAADYGVIDILYGGKSIGSFDGYGASVGVSAPVPLGVIPLKTGRNTLELVLTGKNRRSSGLLVGLDKLTLSIADTTTKPNRLAEQQPNPKALLGEGAKIVAKDI